MQDRARLAEETVDLSRRAPAPPEPRFVCPLR